jgi:hypothetical protein
MGIENHFHGNLPLQGKRVGKRRQQDFHHNIRTDGSPEVRLQSSVYTDYRKPATMILKKPAKLPEGGVRWKFSGSISDLKQAAKQEHIDPFLINPDLLITIWVQKRHPQMSAPFLHDNISNFS